MSLDGGDDASPHGRRGGWTGPVRTFVVTLGAVALVGLGLLVPREARVDDPGRFDPAGLEHQLAELDGARTTEAELARYERVLDATDRRCPASRRELAASAADAQRVADEGGARSTTHALLTSVVRQVGTDGGDCAAAFAEAAQRATRCEPRGQRPCGY